MNGSLVSIITPTFNCGDFIAETIESVLAQTYTAWEMIVFDDCSTDNTKEIVAQYAKQDSRIRYLCNDKNRGAAITRNNALRVAKGRWIAFLDSDDLWLPEKLEKQIHFMIAHNYSFSYHDYVEIDEQSKELGIYVSGIGRVTKFGMYSCCWPGCLSVMYDSAVVGLIQIADVKKNNDTAIWLKAVQRADCYLLKENLAQYRRRKGSISPRSIKEKIRYHYLLFRAAADMNRFWAFVWTGINIIGSSFKKLFYVKSYTPIA